LSRYPDRPLAGVPTTLGSFRAMVGFDHWDGLGCNFGLIFLRVDGLAERGGERDGALGGRQRVSTGAEGRRICLRK
jgi:hypothetical protein